MRAVGKELGVEAMSLYHHVEGKDALLDALADWWFTQVELPQSATPWRHAMADRADSARRALRSHPWALDLVESHRSPGPALLRHHEAVLTEITLPSTPEAPLRTTSSRYGRPCRRRTTRTCFR